MATSTAADIITPEQFAALPNARKYELVDGRLVERNTRNKAALRGSDELSGEDVIPGFRCSVAELFRPPMPRTFA